MNYIIAALIGVVAWQIICMIVYEVSGENDFVLVWVGLFIPACVLSGVALIYRKLCLVWCKKHLNGYRIYHKGSVYVSQIYMTDKQAEKLYNEGESDYYIKRFSDGATWKSVPFRQDIYKGQEKFQGFDMKNLWRNK